MRCVRVVSGGLGCGRLRLGTVWSGEAGIQVFIVSLRWGMVGHSAVSPGKVG